MPIVHQVSTVPRLQAVVRGARRPNDPLQNNIDDVWAEYFDRVAEMLNLKPTLMGTVTLEGQTASIGATDIGGGALGAGLYQLNYYMAVTRAASTSSSLRIQIDFTHNGVAKNELFAAITGNTTATHQSGTKFIRIDKNTPVTYTMTYASVGATTMAYSLDVALFYVGA